MARGAKRKSGSLESSFQLNDLSLELDKLTKIVQSLAERVDGLAKTVSSRPDASQLLNDSVLARGASGPRDQVESFCHHCKCHLSGTVGIPWGSPPSSLFRNSVTEDLARTRRDIASLMANIDLAHSTAMIHEKSYNAVVENFPEPKDIHVDKSRAQRSESDFQTMKEICRKNNLPDPKDVWRHPSRSEFKSRPIKIHFSSSYDRNIFLKCFRRTLPSVADIVGRPFPSARRDMTPQELQLLYILRREAFDRNKAAGANQFYVEDLRLMMREQHSVSSVNVSH